MRLTEFFMPTMRSLPADVEAASHKLMLQSGMIRQVSAGIYTWLPMGLRALEKVTAVVAKVMDEGGISRLLMPTLQPRELWERSGRLESYGRELLRITDRHKRGLLYSPTNEEMVAEMGSHYLKSYRDLPLRVYQIQWKFRDEIRPKGGVMRAREFLMKDAYSFDEDKKAAAATYQLFFELYFKLFKRFGLETVAARADSGQIGGNLSHEFHVLAETGESELYFAEDYQKTVAAGDFKILRELYAAEGEIHDPAAAPKNLQKSAGIEVGHVFYFAAEYSEKMKVAPVGKNGEPFHPHMGSYGVGIARLLAALIETSFDDDGIIWHPAAAPFTVALINLKTEDEKCRDHCEKIYRQLRELGLDVLYDDRPLRAGVKFADMDLVGIPYQLVVAPRELEQDNVTLKLRRGGQKRALPLQAAIAEITEAKTAE